MGPKETVLLVTAIIAAPLALWGVRNPREDARRQAQGRVDTDVDPEDVSDSGAARHFIGAWLCVFMVIITLAVTLPPIMAAMATVAMLLAALAFST